MALSYTTAKWVKLTGWISWSQHTNLIKDQSFDFISVCFFDQFDVALVNSFIVYKELENKDLTLIKEFKICIALKLIASFVSRKLTSPNNCPSNRTKVQWPSPIPPSYLPTFLETRRQCTICSQAGKENRTFVTCSLCDIL